MTPKRRVQAKHTKATAFDRWFGWRRGAPAWVIVHRKRWIGHGPTANAAWADAAKKLEVQREQLRRV